jgi:hypothetical protein
MQRTHDQCIMDVLRNCNDTIRINRVRIYLQASTIANITNAEETHITEYSFGGRNSRTTENPRKSTHQWPRQPRPGPKSWKAWTTALQQEVSTDGKKKLRQPLGKWIVSQQKTRQEWNWYYATTTGQLLQTQANGFKVHNATDHPRQFEDEPKSTIPRLSIDAVPVTVSNNHIPRIPDKHEIRNPNIDHQIPTTFEDYVGNLDHWERTLLRTTGNTKDTNDVTNRIIESEKTYMVSDGGMVNGYGSYGWIIANDDKLT